MARTRSKLSPGKTHLVEPYRDERGRHRTRVWVRNGNNILQCSEGDGYGRSQTALRAIVNFLEAYKKGTVEIMASPFQKSRVGKK